MDPGKPSARCNSIPWLRTGWPGWVSGGSKRRREASHQKAARLTEMTTGDAFHLRLLVRILKVLCPEDSWEWKATCQLAFVKAFWTQPFNGVGERAEVYPHLSPRSTKGSRCGTNRGRCEARTKPNPATGSYFLSATRSLASSKACCIACHIFSSDWVPSIFTIFALG